MATLRPREPDAATRGSKLIHVIRHGQAEHNVEDAALEKRDTVLTAAG